MGGEEVTINDVVQSIIAALKQHFPNIKRYGEEIKEGFQAPCFFIKVFPVSHTREQGRRYLRSHSVDIHYFPATAYANNEMHDMAEKLYEAMEYVAVNGQICRATEMNHEIIDGVLHFYAQYNFHMMREAEEEPVMQDLTQEGYVK
jgi:hypothetical protein